MYTHAATWAVWAYTVAGQPEQAYEAYRRICPPNRSADIDAYKAEPYVTPGNIDGPVSPLYGRGGWTWYTGSAGWLWRVLLEDLLGLRLENGEISFAPRLPSGWTSVSVTLRGKTGKNRAFTLRSDGSWSEQSGPRS